MVAQAEDGPGLLRIVDGPQARPGDRRRSPAAHLHRRGDPRRARGAPPPARSWRSSSSPSTSSRSYTGELLATGESGVGYLLKERVSEIGSFLEAIERVAAGGTALDREVVASLVRDRNRAGGDAELGELTPREREMLEFIAQGRTNAAIGRELVITLGAVEKHVSNIFSKLSLPSTDDDHRRVLAVLAYLRAIDAA